MAERREDMVDVIVVGGGISGLVTAFAALERGLEVRLFEKEDRLGGKVVTREEKGYLIELGPNSALETTPRISQLLESLGMKEALEYARESAARRFVLRDGRLREVPTNPRTFLTSPLFGWKAKLRLVTELFRPPRPREEESLASFVRRRFGKEFLDYAVDPFVAGVYAGDPERLSLQAAFPKLAELERRYGSVLRGAVKGRKERKKRESEGEVSKQSARIFSLERGLGQLTDALARRLGQRATVGSEVVALHEGGGKWTVRVRRDGEETLHMARSVVLAAPAYSAAELLRPLDEDLAEALRRIAYPPVAVVVLGYSREAVGHDLEGFGFLVPRVEKREILGSLWISSIFSGRAPKGEVSLTTFLGGTRQPESASGAEEELVRRVHDELTRILGLSERPRFAVVKRWERAIPQYELGYKYLLEKLEAFERAHPGLFFCANFKGGISFADCIANGYTTAEKLSERVSEAESSRVS